MGVAAKNNAIPVDKITLRLQTPIAGFSPAAPSGYSFPSIGTELLCTAPISCAGTSPHVELMEKYFSVTTARLFNLYGPWPGERTDLVHEVITKLWRDGRTTARTRTPERPGRNS